MKRLQLILFAALFISVMAVKVEAQSVPGGIHYQAVARDNTGRELADKDLSVKFTVLSGSPLGAVVYEELHSGVKTSKYGVFSLVVGKGTPTGGSGTFSQIDWGSMNHYLKVEIKFANDFLEMGTMQFMAVPYALYALKSLEPGPQGVPGTPGPAGPKGDPGDPATDDQALSFDGNILSILSHLGGTKINEVDLSSLRNDPDFDPSNELQDLKLTNHSLTISKLTPATEIDLSPYNQSLNWDPATRKLGISNSTAKIDLTELKNDADADPANEAISDIRINGSSLEIVEGGITKSVNLSSNMVAFRAKKPSISTAQYIEIPITSTDVLYNDGSGFNGSTGEFTAPITGIYSFYVNYYADAPGGGRILRVLHFTPASGIFNEYEILAEEITIGMRISRSISLKLNAGEKVKLVLFTGSATTTGVCSFSGYRVY